MKATVAGEHRCDQNWYMYLHIGPITGIPCWLFFDRNPETMAKKTVYQQSTCLCFVFLAGTQHYVPIKLMAVTGNPRYLTIRGNLQRNQIHKVRNLLLDSLETAWSSVLLKLGNSEVSLATSVTIPLIGKHIVRNMMDNNELISYIMLPTPVTWQVLTKSMVW